MIPTARILHSTSLRLRIRVPGRKGDAPYFKALCDRMTPHLPDAEVSARPEIGTFVVRGRGIDPEAVAEFGRTSGLFDLHSEPGDPVMEPARPIAQIVRGIDRELAAFTGGAMNAPGLLFSGLVIWGIIELARGRFKSPPWYTAFWYAFGLFTKSLLDEKNADPGSLL